MATLTPHIKMLISSLIVSKNAIVGGIKGAEKLLISFLTQIEELEDTNELRSITKAPIKLLEIAKTELKDNIPDENEIKNWLLYDIDFSGITFYETHDGKLTFAKLVRSLDLSTGDQYDENRIEAKAYSDAFQTNDPVKIKIAEDALKANLPGRKLKYLHWIGSKPTEIEIAEFRKSNSLYF